MKLAYLTELAALLSSHSHLWIQQPQGLSSTLLGEFYVQSRNRFNRWHRRLNDSENSVIVQDPQQLTGLNPVRPPIQSITEQILINDLLNRVWTVMTTCVDRHRREDRVGKLMSNVFRGHLVIRKKALNRCFNDTSLSREQVNLINQLRASTERWSDLLCSVMMGEFGLWEYAHDRARAQDFFQGQFAQGLMKPGHHVWTLILSGLRQSFPEQGGLGARLDDDDRLIAGIIMEAFPEAVGHPSVRSGSTQVQAEQ